MYTQQPHYSVDDNVLIIDQADRDLALRQLTASFSINLQALSLLVAGGLVSDASGPEPTFLRRRSLISQLRLMGVTTSAIAVAAITTSHAARRWWYAGLGHGLAVSAGLIGLLTTTMDDLNGNTADQEAICCVAGGYRQR